MGHYTAEVSWHRGTQPFVDNRYSRSFLLRFDGGLEVPGSASPSVVKVPLSDPAAVDPEEAFVAALAGCHMLWFLSLAAARRFCVDRYHDHATGLLAHDANGRMAITVVTLRPAVVFSGATLPDRRAIEALHAQAHAACFIANSVKSELRCEPVYEAAGAD